MARVIRLYADNHNDILQILPWYVTGQLDAGDQAQVRAHLGGCPDCQAEIRFQRRLGAEIEGLPVEIEQGWRRMKARVQAQPQALPSIRRAILPWLGWAAAAGLVLVIGGMMQQPVSQAPAYHVLGAAPVDARGNLIVVFAPGHSPESALKAARVRLVGGPTAAGAYVLHAPQAERAADLEVLRRQPGVVSAASIDAGAAP